MDDNFAKWFFVVAVFWAVLLFVANTPDSPTEDPRIQQLEARIQRLESGGRTARYVEYTHDFDGPVEMQPTDRLVEEIYINRAGSITAKLKILRGPE